MQYNAIQCNTMQYNAIQCNTMQYNAIQCNTMQYNAMQCNGLTGIASGYLYCGPAKRLYSPYDLPLFAVGVGAADGV